LLGVVIDDGSNKTSSIGPSITGRFSPVEFTVQISRFYYFLPKKAPYENLIDAGRAPKKTEVIL